jgi:hypothetical protein
VSSQRLLNDSTAVVHISALKNAIKVKAELNNTKNQLKVSRDTIKTFSKIIHRQDSIIRFDSNQIVLFQKNSVRQDSIVRSYKGVIQEKENKISDLQEQLSKSYLLTGIVGAISVILIILL